MIALYDVNALLPLFVSGHASSSAIRRWHVQNSPQGWATCPITQNGFLRIATQPAFEHMQPVETAGEMLRMAVSQPDHHFWPDDISITDTAIFAHRHVQGHRQLTDVYLLALAVRNGGRLVTFDRRLSIESVRGAKPENLVILPLEA